MFDLQNNYIDQDGPWEGILVATDFTVKSTHQTTLKTTSGQLMFGCDMISNNPFIYDWEYIRRC